MNFNLIKKITDFSILEDLIRKVWIAHFKDDPEFREVEEYLDTNLLDRMAHDKYKGYMVFNAQQFKLTYVGGNVEESSGYTAQELLSQQFSLIFKILRKSHILFFYKVLGWAKALVAKYPNECAEYLSYSIFGLTFKHKAGHEIKLFVRVYPVSLTKLGNYKNAILELIDITSMIKTEEYWIHATVGKFQKSSMTFFSDGNDKGNLDLITKRELEILRLISDNLSTKDIAEQLFISPATVDKHRKNMIARVGVRDTFALVEICRRCGII